MSESVSQLPYHEATLDQVPTAQVEPLVVNRQDQLVLHARTGIRLCTLGAVDVGDPPRAVDVMQGQAAGAETMGAILHCGRMI